MTRMIRTQIYLPPDLFSALKHRSERDGIPMAEQIRTALRAYLSTTSPPLGVLREDDPLWEIVGAAEGPADAAEEHDKYIYGWGRTSS